MTRGPTRTGVPKRGEIFMAGLEPVIGHEQGGRRPFLVLSIAQMNQAGVELAIGMPLTTTPTGSVLHVRIEPSQSGLERVSYVMSEMIRSVSLDRFGGRVGRAPFAIVDRTANLAGFVIGLGQTKY